LVTSRFKKSGLLLNLVQAYLKSIAIFLEEVIFVSTELINFRRIYFSSLLLKSIFASRTLRDESSIGYGLGHVSVSDIGFVYRFNTINDPAIGGTITDT
jgi:hypothetical protein